MSDRLRSAPRVRTLAFGLPLVLLASIPSRVTGAGQSAVLAAVVTAVGGHQPPASMTVGTAFGVRVLQLTSATAFSIDGDPSAGASVASDLSTLVNRWVEATFDASTGSVASVDVQSHVRTSGPVLSVSDSQPPASLSIDLPFGGSQSLSVTPNTDMPNTDPGTDLQTFQGTFVWVEYDPTSLEIVKLLPLQELQRLHGRIDSVDPASASLTVSDATQTLTLQVQPFLEDFGAITLDFESVTIADLRPGLEVIVDYVDDEGLGASSIAAVTPDTVSVNGTVARVSLSSQTVTLRSSGGGRPGRWASPARPTLLKVTPGTRIMLNGHEASLRQIPAGASVQARIGLAKGAAFVHTLTVRTRH